MNGRKVTGAIRSLVNAKSLELACAMVLRETFFVPVLLYDSEIVIWREKERSRIMAVHMDIL